MSEPENTTPAPGEPDEWGNIHSGIFQSLKWCIGCEKYLPFDKYGVNKRNKDGLTSRCSRCHCELVKEATRKRRELVPIDNLGAYTHVIRDRYGYRTLFRYSILDGEVPKGYDIIYRALPGQLLPKQYWVLNVYENIKV